MANESTVQTSAFYDTLFGDLPLAEWAAQGEKLDAAPWPTFREAAAFQVDDVDQTDEVDPVIVI